MGRVAEVNAATALAYLSATEALHLFRSRAVSPVEVLQAQIDRAGSIADTVNAVTYTHFEAAREAARQSERRWRAGEARPLEGITCAVKDEAPVEGWTTTIGSKLLKDNVEAYDHPIIERLKHAGAVLHLQTTVPEMCVTATCWTDLWGVTRNPWNLHYTTGGSSGGSGAALAAGITTLATGSDMGGSIRIPASLNGLYGFKPPYGRVPGKPEDALLLMATDGPMARTFDDLRAMQNVISGPYWNSPIGLPRLELPDWFAPVAGLRLAVDYDLGYGLLDPDVRANTKAAVEGLAHAGAEIVEVNLGWDRDEITRAATDGLLSTSIGAALIDLLAFDEGAGGGNLTSYVYPFAEQARSGAGPREYQASANVMAALYASLSRQVFEQQCAVLLCPTVASRGVAADLDPHGPPVLIDGQAVPPNVEWTLTPPFNLLNRCPVVSVPTGRGDNGVPTGMQIVANNFDDVSVFRVAAAHAALSAPLFAGDDFPDLRAEP